jgi:hypothetical protein
VFVRFVFTSSCLYEGVCPIYVICVCLHIVMSNTYCDVSLCCCLRLVSYVPNVASFSEMSNGGKEEPYIVFMGEIVADITTWKMTFVVLKLPIL